MANEVSTGQVRSVVIGQRPMGGGFGWGSVLGTGSGIVDFGLHKTDLPTQPLVMPQIGRSTLTLASGFSLLA